MRKVTCNCGAVLEIFAPSDYAMKWLFEHIEHGGTLTSTILNKNQTRLL